MIALLPMIASQSVHTSFLSYANSVCLNELRTVFPLAHVVAHSSSVTLPIIVIVVLVLILDMLNMLCT